MNIDKSFKEQTAMMGDIHHWAWRANRPNESVFINPRDAARRAPARAAAARPAPRPPPGARPRAACVERQAGASPRADRNAHIQHSRSVRVCMVCVVARSHAPTHTHLLSSTHCTPKPHTPQVQALDQGGLRRVGGLHRVADRHRHARGSEGDKAHAGRPDAARLGGPQRRGGGRAVAARGVTRRPRVCLAPFRIFAIAFL